MRIQSKTRMRLLACGGVALVIAFQFPATAVAQTAADTAPEESANSAVSGDIVVTAQKREEKLRDVPISISAVTGDALQRIGATRFTDFAGYIPGMAFSAGSIPGDGEINLRGVTTATSPTASTAIYIDEVPTTTHGTWGGSGYKPVDLFPYDLERVEVLRGPQGTLYGDSTIGGLVKYVTRTADVDEFSAAAGAEATTVSGGEGLGFGVRAMLNAPIAAGVFGVRVSGFYQKTPGYITNRSSGKKGVNEIDQRGVRVALRLAPTDNFSIDAQWLHSEIESDGHGSTILAPGTTEPLYGDYIDEVQMAEPSSSKFDLLSATGRLDFGPVNLTAVTGYSRTKRDNDSDNSPMLNSWINILTGGAVTDGQGIFDSPITNEKFSQEIRLASSPDQRFSWQIGGYYTVEDTDVVQRLVPYRADGTVMTELLEIYRDAVTAKYTDVSAFANATFKITDKWEISGGIRHSRITDDFHEEAVGSFLSGSPTIPYFDDIKAKYRATTWSASTRYIASDDLMVFARAASGFRAGGINYTWPGAEKSYDPDSLVSYEAGIRAVFLSDKASIDLTVYYLDWKDLFIIAYTPDEFQYGYQINGGRANGLGTEFTGTLRPVRGLTLTATAANYGLKIREDLPTIGAEAGDRTPTSPAWSGSITADYKTSIGGDWDLNVGGGLRMVSHTYTRFIHDPATLRLDGYTAVDLNAAVTNDRWTLRGYVRNLTNNDVVVSEARGRGVQMAPRTIGMALDFRF